MNKKFTKLIAALALLVFMTPSMAGWGQSTATITFANQTSGTSDSNTEYTTDNFVSVGIASSDAAFGTISCSATGKCYSGKVGCGLKAGAKSSAGSFTIAFSSLENVTKITLNRASYNTNNAATITVKNGNTTLASVSTPSGSTDFANMEITNLSIESLSGLTVETTKYCYIKSITITYGNDKATTTTIDASGITNTNKYVGTEAGSLSASVTYGSPAAAVPNASVTWSGDKNTVATINSTTGAVTLVGAGTVTFTASFEGLPGYGTSSATYVMTVTNEDPALSTIWSEDFYGYSADAVPSGGTYSYACTNGTKTSGSTNGGVTAVKDEKLAEGTAKPELMVGKKGSGEGAQGGTFSATIPLASSNGYGYSGDLTLTYKTNANSLNVKTTTSGITVDGESTTGAGVTFNTKDTHTVTFKGVTTSTTNITIVFTATTTSNVRLDDIVLKGVITIPVNENNEIVSNVTIPAGASYVVPSTGIKVPSGKTLTVNGTLINNNPSNLIIEDGGQLYTEDVVEATIKKNISQYTIAANDDTDPDNVVLSNGWYFISYPLNTNGTNGDDPTSVPNMIASTATNYDLYELNGNVWENYKAHTADFTLSNGHGYLYANANGVNLEFAGSLNFRDQENDFVSLDNTGWNLVGNPFAYNTYPSMNYYKMNEAGTRIYATEYTTADAVSPCTGILVYDDEDNPQGLITFSKTAPESGGAKGGINLTLAETKRGVNKLDNAIVSFNEGSQLGKFYFGTQNANLYIPQGTKEYAIVSANGQGEMPVNFKANEDGQYTLTVNPENVEMNYLHLIDNMTGMNVDLLQTPSYSFEAKTTDYESRFRLVFASNDASTGSASDESFAFFSDGNLIINNDGQATLQVMDITGRILSSETVDGSVSKTINVTPGVYMLRLVNGDNVKVQKVVVR